jgi:putative transposase
LDDSGEENNMARNVVFCADETWYRPGAQEHDRKALTADIAIDGLTMAWFGRKPAPGLSHHPDRDSHYASEAFQGALKRYGMVCSMSRKGNCRDNAPTESFFNSLKNERVHGTRCATREEAVADLFDYIEVFCNRTRRHSTLGCQSPVQFLQD